VNILEELVAEMFEDCWQCGGTGWEPVADPPPVRPNMPARPPQRPCHTCHTRGEVLTEWGQIFLDRLVPHLAREVAGADHTHTLS
jgi:hypothetical protein